MALSGDSMWSFKTRHGVGRGEIPRCLHTPSPARAHDGFFVVYRARTVEDNGGAVAAKRGRAVIGPAIRYRWLSLRGATYIRQSDEDHGRMDGSQPLGALGRESITSLFRVSMAFRRQVTHGETL